MIHVNWSKFKFTEEPFPAYRCELIYGRNKRDFEFLPVSGVVPDEEGILPSGKFKVIKTKAKGTIMIVNGEDNTNRCLLMVGVNGGFRGDCGLVEKETTGKVLKICSAGNACESSTQVIALLEPGQRVVFYSYGRRNNDIIVFTWDGQEIHHLSYTKKEWEQCACTCEPSQEVEEI